MKPKEWLFQNGHITREEANKRGRMSKVNVDLIKEAVSQGVKIDGYETVKPVKATADDKPEPTVARVANDPSRIVDCPEPLRDESQFKAFVNENGKPKEIGKRTVCNACHSSLPYCPCPSPRVWVDYDREGMVTFTYN